MAVFAKFPEGTIDIGDGRILTIERKLTIRELTQNLSCHAKFISDVGADIDCEDLKSKIDGFTGKVYKGLIPVLIS